MLESSNNCDTGQTWRAVDFAPPAIMTRSRRSIKWLPWQDGKNALALTLPSTKLGSSHDGIFFGCGKCGKDIVHPYDIYCIMNTVVWTRKICSRNGPVVDYRQHEEELLGIDGSDGLEKSYFQIVQCQCKNEIGKFYQSLHVDSERGGASSQGIPCYKLETVRERWNWADKDMPSMAMVLLGSREDVEKSIAKLSILNDQEFDRHPRAEGTRDQATQTETTKTEVFDAEAEAETEVKCTPPCEVTHVVETELSKLKTKDESVCPSMVTQQAKEKQSARTIARFKGPILKRIIWECNLHGSWLHYPSDICDTLECAYSKGTVATFSLEDKTFEINFAKSLLVQRNIATNRLRNVRRREVQDEIANSWVPFPSDSSCQLMECDSEQFVENENAKQINTDLCCQPKEFYSAGAIKVPSTWTMNPPTNAESSSTLINVPTSSLEWKNVEKQLVETIKCAKVHEILRVQNVLLWEYFCFRADRLVKLSGGKAPNIVNVWHGTRETNPEIICTDEADGFMMQHSRTGLWGQGIYFAEKASRSHHYAFQTIQTDRCFFSDKQTVGRSVILAKLIAGDEVSLKPDSTLRHCPGKPGSKGKRYDTVTGHSKGSKVYVVYENGRAYPEYIVTYTVN